MAGIRVFMEGLDDQQRRLLGLGLALRDLRPFWPRVVALFTSWMGRQFDTEGGFFGEQWAPLSPAYAAWKAVNFPGKRILQATGALRRAATSPTRVPSPLMLELRIEPYENRGQTLDPAWFQDGTDRMPARPLLAEHLPAQAYAELDAAAALYATETLRRLGLV